MGSFFKSGSETSTSTSDSSPWEPQQKYLKYGFEQALDAYKDADDTGPYGGPRVAPLTGNQDQILRLIQNVATGVVPGENLWHTGEGLLGGLGQAQAGYQNLLANVRQDPTQTTIDRATLYANNPYLQSMIDNASGDIMNAAGIRQAGNDAGATAGGLGSSTRAGLVEALNRKDALAQVGRASTDLRSAAYTSGLGLAASQLQNQQQNALAAVAGLGGTGQAGAGLMQQGYTLGQDALQQALLASSLYQDQRQREIDAERGAFQEQKYGPLELVQQYMATVGGNYGGTTTTETTKPTASPFQMLLGTGLQAARVAAMF